MKFGNLPEIVKYSEFGKESFALPIGSRSPEHHTGANDEPLLHLVIVAPVPDPLDPKHEAFLNIVGTTRENELVKIVHDVPHESQEFTAEQIEAIGKTGITFSQAYPGGKMTGGRWKELSSVELNDLLSVAVGREGVLAEKAAQAKAAADEAQSKVAEAAAAVQANTPAPVDDITREALIRNKQEELKTAAPAKVETPAAPEPVKAEPEGGTGSGTVQ